MLPRLAGETLLCAGRHSRPAPGRISAVPLVRTLALAALVLCQLAAGARGQIDNAGEQETAECAPSREARE